LLNLIVKKLLLPAKKQYRNNNLQFSFPIASNPWKK